MKGPIPFILVGANLSDNVVLLLGAQSFGNLNDIIIL